MFFIYQLIFFFFRWQKVLSGIRSDQAIFDRSGWSKIPQDSLKLNVLMFGFDSLSHNMWKWHLKKTYKYATQDLKGIALNGYNIVGDGTPQALIPILTGQTELGIKRQARFYWFNTDRAKLQFFFLQSCQTFVKEWRVNLTS